MSSGEGGLVWRMTVRDIVYSACMAKNLKLTNVAARVNMLDASLSRMLSRDKDEGMKMRLDTFLKLMEALDLEVIVQDPWSEIDDEYVLDGDSDSVEYYDRELNE